MDDTSRSQAALSEQLRRNAETCRAEEKRVEPYYKAELAANAVEWDAAADALDANARILARVAALCDEAERNKASPSPDCYIRPQALRAAMAGAEHASADAAGND
jgi:hypothetical protein